MKSYSRLGGLLAVALLAGCQHDVVRETAPATPPAAAEPQHDTFNAVAWMQTSAEYAALTTQSYRDACDALDAALADPGWSALPDNEQGNGFETLPPAVVSDVDETLLDNSPFAVRSIRSNHGFDPVAWKAWINEADARPMPGVMELLSCLHDKGVTLIYISNRNHEGERQATIDNLRKAGFPLPEGAEDRVLLRDDPRGATPDHNDKGARRRWVAKRYRVVELLGDNLGDFMDGVSATPAQRARMAQSHSAMWGRRWFVFPNPSYGSWLNALLVDCPQAKTDPAACRDAALRDQ